MPKLRSGLIVVVSASLVACSHATPAVRQPSSAHESEEAAPARGPARLAAGSDHACAIDGDRVFCWGSAERRALGIDPLALSLTEMRPPVLVPDAGDPVEIAAGLRFSCVRSRTGPVVCWGDVPTNSDWTEAAQQAEELIARARTGGIDAIRVEGERTRRVAIDEWHDAIDLGAQGNHACVVHADGTVSCRGFAGNRPAFQPRVDPRGRVEGIAGATEVAVGIGHLCALLESGRVICAGTLGDVEPEPDEPPPSVLVPGIEDAVQVAAGADFACALSRTGRVSCWGVLAPGASRSRTSEPVVIEGAGPARAIAASGSHVCAIRTSGRVRCWGSGFYGELGDGSTVDRSQPVEVAGIEGAIEIGAGYEYTCARTARGLSCWGRNEVGQLGNREQIPAEFLTTVEGVTDAIDVEVGASHVCVARSDGRVVCWGNDNHGQLGDGPGPWRSRSPVWVEGLAGVIDVSAGPLSTCARTQRDEVYCWGQWLGGAVGADLRFEDGARADRPVRVEALDGSRAIVGGRNHGCAIDEGGRVLCWGSNRSGQVDGSPSAVHLDPVPVLRARSAVAISAVDDTSCAVLADGSIRAWGRELAVPRGESGTRFVDVSCGSFMSCGITTAREVSCVDSDGQPTADLGLTGATSVRCTEGDSCCAIANGALQCWSGLGLVPSTRIERMRDGSFDLPVALPANDPVAFGTNGEAVCWAERGGAVRCWGTRNTTGQLGATTAEIRVRPVAVAEPIEIDESAILTRARERMGLE